MTTSNTLPPPRSLSQFLADPASPSLAAGRTALFLDFDGTLAEIVDDPSQARIEPQLLDCLSRLFALADGALAVVSGRPIAQLDDLLHPLTLPLAGMHGSERRDSLGHHFTPAIDDLKLSQLATRLRIHAVGRPGLIVEEKPASVALHYRQRPELAGEALALAADIVRADPEVRLLRGKMVVELSLGHRTKGDAIAHFMAEPPFAGRLPVFAGDDVTDEDGFRVLGRWDGISIKVGSGPTAAAFRVGHRGEIAAWLESLSARWDA